MATPLEKWFGTARKPIAELVKDFIHRSVPESQTDDYILLEDPVDFSNPRTRVLLVPKDFLQEPTP